MPSFSLRKGGGWKASYVSLCAWLTNDNALLFITTQKATYLPRLSSVWVASKLATALPDVLRTAVKRAGCGDTQQQQQLNRKVSAELPEVSGVMERCKSNVSRVPLLRSGRNKACHSPSQPAPFGCDAR